ncbi:MAG TPA: ATP-binding protein, partial [Methylothermaceae bacterium]|nr:ATP-binding protein [Methylothermaceae bacterium]
SPSQPRKYGKHTINTLWGELAWQLQGEAGFRQVADSDRDGTSPGKGILTDLIRQSAPCVVLMDELVAFIRQLEIGKQYKAGTFDSNVSFIQALTEAMKSVPNAILLASLPESEVEAGGAMGQRALNSLEKYFARIESVWKPVATEEAFEIVRRRLFENPGDRAEVEGISRQFSDFYRQHAEKFPVETQSNDYFERLCRSYPIHPEIFDRLYEDWSTLEKFQRTRGVLQYMAIVIHRLWNTDNRDALIMPGTLPLDDSNVRTKSIHYLPQGWEPVIEREIDGPQSVPFKIDGHDTRFGSVQAARRTTRTIFLGSAPAAANQAVRGIETERIMLGALQPGQTPGMFEDVLKRLRDRLHYLYSEQDRYWFDTRPNLRREMESRKQNVSEREELQPLIKARVTRIFGSNHGFGGIHVFTPSSDIPDDYGRGPRLVVLPTNAAYSRGDSNQAYAQAEEILRKRGDQPRQKQNRLIFLAPDFDVVGRMKEQGRIYLAWNSIVTDIENGTLNQDISHLNQAKRSRDHAEKSLEQLIRETWKWLIAPMEEFAKGKPQLEWEAVQVSPVAPNLVQAIEEKLREEEWLIYEWSPIHLRNLLKQWYLKDGGGEVNALKVWQDTCHYLYLPRLITDQVFRDAIAKGVATEDYFGFAAGKDGERYLGFVFGQPTTVVLDESSVLIDREAALAWRDHVEHERRQQEDGGGVSAPPQTVGGESTSGSRTNPTHTGGERSGDPVTSTKRRFYGTVTLDPIKAKMDFATIIDGVVEPFTSKLGVEVEISVEIRARDGEGFDDALQRIIKENCSVLKFNNSEFEEDV